MKKTLKVIAISLIALLAASFTACGKQSGVFVNSGTTRRAAADSQKKQITLKLWHIWGTDSDSNRIPFEKALSKWNSENADIAIEADATEVETYKTKIRTAMAVNEAPDIFYSWGAGFAKPFVEAQKVLALDEYINDGTKEKLLPGTLENFIYDGKTYGLPIYMTAIVFYCNRELFEKNSIRMPDTFDELLEAVKAFRKAGVTPIVAGQKDKWPGMFYQNILALRTAGTRQCNQALKKEGSFNNPDFIESAAKLTELIRAGAFDERCMRLTAREAEEEFINGRAAMYYNGSWAVGSLEKADSPVKGKIVVENFPVLKDYEKESNEYLGGAIDTFMISAGTQYKEEAVKALKSIDESFCKESYITGASQPAWKIEVDESTLNPLAVDISNMLKKSTGFVLAWDTFLEAEDAEKHKYLVAEIFAGSRSPEEFALEMQKLNEKAEIQ